MNTEKNIIESSFGEVLNSPSMADQLLKGLEDRQKEVLLGLPKYAKYTSIIGFILLILGLIIQSLTGNLPNEQLQLINSLNSPTIGGIISFFFTIIAYVLNAIFAVWAISFIPYFAIKSFKASQKIKIPLRTNTAKWIQLFSAVLLPIIAFAIFASNIPSTKSSFIINLTFKDFLVIFGGAILIWAVLFYSVKLISLKFVVVHLTIYSILLYTVIFFAYILGFGTITYAAVLGMMFFLMFSSDRLSEIVQRISIYDIDFNIADKLSAVANRENTIKVKEAEADVGKIDRELSSRVEKLKNEDEIAKQLQDIKTSQNIINSKINTTKLDTLNKKLELFNGLFTILSDEYDLKVDEEFPTLLNNFKANVKNMSSSELGQRMENIINQVNDSLDTIPKGLDNLRIEMRKATQELKQATEELNED